MAWVWVTPIMYSKDIITDSTILTLLNLNPLTPIVEGYQSILYWKAVPDITTLIVSGAISLIMLAIGAIAYHFLEKDFAEVL